MTRALYTALRTPACDGYPASDRELPLWASLAAEREGRRIAEELQAQVGAPMLLVVRTHHHTDGSWCAHVADRAFKITRWSVTERKPRKAKR